MEGEGSNDVMRWQLCEWKSNNRLALTLISAGGSHVSPVMHGKQCPCGVTANCHVLSYLCVVLA